MIYVPFVYFSLLFIFLFIRNKRRIDMAGYIVLIFAISAYFSIKIDALNLRDFDTISYHISIWAAVTYCGLITVCLLPIIKYSSVKITKIRPLRNVSWLKIYAIFSFLYMLMFLILSMNNIIYVLTNDMGDLRNDMYNSIQEAGWMERMNPIARIPFSFINLILGCPWILQFMAFFSLLVQKLPKKYFIMLLLASLLGPINGIIGVDRSNVAYWILSLVACVIFYKGLMSKKQKKVVFTFLGCIIGLLVLYLVALTLSRFEDSTTYNSVDNSLIVYLGQPYINFCFFLDTYKCPYPTLVQLFPFISNMILGVDYSGVDLQLYLSLLSGFSVNVFYTFLGGIAFTSSIWIAVAYCAFFSVMAFSLFKRSNINLIYIYTYFLFCSVLFLGLFNHYYAGAARTFSFIFFYFLLYFNIVKPIKK